MNTTLSFYDDLAERYQRIASDWDAAVVSQGKILSELIKRHHKDTSSLKVLDCSCGIGTQAIGLALQGFQVHATDLSSKAVEKAKGHADRLNVKMSFGVADFRSLSRDVNGQFDVIVSCDNSIPHILKDKDLKISMANIYEKLESGGVFIASIRNYDEILKTKPTGTIPKRIQDEFGERIYTQVWTWSSSNNEYEVELFLIEKSDSVWETHSYKTRYRALKQKELTDYLHLAGFKSVTWLTPEESGYYQPIVMAIR